MKIYLVAFLCISKYISADDDDFEETGLSRVDLEKAVHEAEFILEGRLGELLFSIKYGYWSEWLEKPKVHHNYNKEGIQKNVVFGHKTPENKPHWDPSSSVIVFGLYKHPDNYPKVRTIVSLKNGITGDELFQKLKSKPSGTDYSTSLTRSNMAKYGKVARTLMN